MQNQNHDQRIVELLEKQEARQKHNQVGWALFGLPFLIFLVWFFYNGWEIGSKNRVDYGQPMTATERVYETE